MPTLEKKQLVNDPLEKVVEEIIKTSGLDDLPLGDHNYLKEHLLLQLNRRLGLIITGNLNEEGLEKYSQLLTDGPVPDPVKLQVLLEKYIPDYQEKIKVGLDEFIKQILASLTNK